jgi:PEGA domain
MRYSVPKLLMLFILPFLSYNCASIIHGNKQDISFTSQPTGATLYIDDHKIGPTPKIIRLPRKGRIKGENSAKKSYKIKIELEGYLPYEIYVRRDVDNWVWGNLMSFSIYGIIIDALTGSMYRLTPDQVVGQLPKDARIGRAQSSDGKLLIAMTLKIDPTWQKVGSLEKIK